MYQNDLHEHVRGVNINQNCMVSPVCGKTFMNRYQIIVPHTHWIVHGQVNYVGKILSRPSGLHKHTRIHHMH